MDADRLLRDQAAMRARTLCAAVREKHAARLLRNQAAMRARLLRAAARAKQARFDLTKKGRHELLLADRERRAFDRIGDYLRAQKRAVAIRRAGAALVTHSTLGYSALTNRRK